MNLLVACRSFCLFFMVAVVFYCSFVCFVIVVVIMCWLVGLVGLFDLSVDVAVVG